VLVVSSALAVYNDGFKNRFEVVGGFENYEIDNKTLKRESWSLLRKREKESPNFKEVPNKVLIVGNSHAKDIFNVLHQNISGFDGFDFLRGMIPQLNCFNETIKEYENKRRAFYESRSYRDATTILVSTRYRLTALCFGITKGSQPESSDLDGLKYLIKRAKKDGKNVVVMGNHAEFRKYNKKWVADHIYHLHSNNKDSTYVPAFAKIKVEAANLLYKQLNKRKVELTQKVKAISQDNNVSFYDKLPLICDMKGDVCDAFTEEGHKMFYDYGHFTLEGAKSIGFKLLSDSGFKKLLLHSEIASKVSN
jgi:hypothetical protein